jgi:hypothetical protein
VTKSEFDRVQYILGLRGKPRPIKRQFAFTGLIKCGECGCAITAEHKINRRYGYEYDYYHCTKRKRSVHCGQKVIEVKALEAQIAAFLETITITKDISDWCSYVFKELARENEGKDKLTAHIQWQRLEACKREIDELLTCKIRKLITDEEFAQKRQELITEKFRLKELVDDRDHRFDEVFQLGVDAFNFAEMARRTFETGTIEEKRKILRYSGSNLVLNNQKLSIEPRKPLLYIQKTLETKEAREFMIEPRKLSYVNAKAAPLGSGASLWLGLVEDVRTFLCESMDSV